MTPPSSLTPLLLPTFRVSGNHRLAHSCSIHHCPGSGGACRHWSTCLVVAVSVWTTAAESLATARRTSTSTSMSALEQARKLQRPEAVSTLAGESEHAAFWSTHGSLLRQAWKEYEQTGRPNQTAIPALTELLALPAFPQSLDWNPIMWASGEGAVGHGGALERRGEPLVYSTELLSPQGIRWFRSQLDIVAASGIPTRRPNGMNRFGVIVDDPTGVDGAVAWSALSDVCRRLVQNIARPSGRKLFARYVRDAQDDNEMYAFTVRYNATEDVELKEHRDASLITINVNLNLPDEEDSYQGSSLYFVDPTNGEQKFLQFHPGMAILHKGATRHAAVPIQQGQRCNLVIWLFGTDGYVRIAPYDDDEEQEEESKGKEAAMWTDDEL